MNRYPLWKNLSIAFVLLVGLLYTLPNFFGESPAVQISSAHRKVDLDVQREVLGALDRANVKYSGSVLDTNSVRVRFDDVDTQLKGKDVIEHALNPDEKNATWLVALNLLPKSPAWLSALLAKPMNLGLDLRGGVHFLLQVDMNGAITKKLDATAADVRTQLREKDIRHGGVNRDGITLVMKFRDDAVRKSARLVVADNHPELTLTERNDGSDILLVASLSPDEQKKIQEKAIQQNMTTLHKRIDGTGVTEPTIQQQGPDRIVVQFPGVQDTSQIKDRIGATASLEVRLVQESDLSDPSAVASSDTFPEYRQGVAMPVYVKKQVVLTGDHFVDASPGFDQNHNPAVNVVLDSTGGRIMGQVTRDNIKKRMAIILFEKDKGEAISVATIQSEFRNRFEISGNFSAEETNRLSVLIRAGALAAPMEIIEERTIGPSLGADNIEKGFKSTLWGFLAIAAFMCLYYRVFGLISTLALGANLLLLVAILSILPTTLTLPGMAAIALTLGMAIDANVLINERVREELRNGAAPQAAIDAGYERAFGTILDSNVTTFIAGIALYFIGSGPVQSFAAVHCLGILTSMFSSVVISRMITNLVYGRRRKLDTLAIGQVWKAGQ